MRRGVRVRVRARAPGCRLRTRLLTGCAWAGRGRDDGRHDGAWRGAGRRRLLACRRHLVSSIYVPMHLHIYPPLLVACFVFACAIFSAVALTSVRQTYVGWLPLRGSGRQERRAQAQGMTALTPRRSTCPWCETRAMVTSANNATTLHSFCLQRHHAARAQNGPSALRVRPRSRLWAHAPCAGRRRPALA